MTFKHYIQAAIRDMQEKQTDQATYRVPNSLLDELRRKPQGTEGRYDWWKTTENTVFLSTIDYRLSPPQETRRVTRLT